MKKYEWLHQSAARSRRCFGLKSSIFGLLAFALIGFSGCEITECSEDPEPIGFCGTEPSTQNCNIYATAETVVCGAGIWYNTWLRLDDGTLLQPWETNIQGAQLVEGQRYKIGYELMQRDNRYQNAVICQAVPPAAQAARITCLEADSVTTNAGK